MALAAIIISIVAVMTSVVLGWRALKLTRHSNTMPVLIDLFREHRSERLAEARYFVYNDLPKYDISLGIDGLPNDKKTLVRDLAWFYDNLGTLVTHGVIDVEPVSGYLGQSVVVYWEKCSLSSKPNVRNARIRTTQSGGRSILRISIA